MNITKLICAMAIIFSSGCSTMYFENGNQVNANSTYEQWHHNYALSLVEGSDSIQPKNVCQKKWASVKTELTFLNGLAGGVINGIVPMVWYPKTVEIACE